MTVSLPATVNDGFQIQSLFPLCIMLAKPASSAEFTEVEVHSVYPISSSLWFSSKIHNLAQSDVPQGCASYNFNRSCILTSFHGDEGVNHAQANFILPEINKLSAEIKSGSLAILFISRGMPVCVFLDHIFRY